MRTGSIFFWRYTFLVKATYESEAGNKITRVWDFSFSWDENNGLSSKNVEPELSTTEDFDFEKKAYKKILECDQIFLGPRAEDFIKKNPDMEDIFGSTKPSDWNTIVTSGTCSTHLASAIFDSQT
ncbi:hypothetical protein [Pseudomonas chlororaphis]|uniref:hypothetical protein n=1 Tax=Pseudomonas chlororaphis TaxID=587753 RepID=UPI000F5728BC|nr:hypothetical protein [Pseudomonas chlororaphis]